MNTNNESDIFMLLLPASQIPEGSVCCKPTGEKEYTLRKTIRIYGAVEAGGTTQEIKIPDAVFLVAADGAISAVKGDSVLKWMVLEEELFDWLQRRDFDREDRFSK